MKKKASSDLWARFNNFSIDELADISKEVEQGAKDIVASIKAMIPAVGIRSKSGKLANSVKYEMRGMLHAKIFVDSTEAPYAAYLEDGYSPFDMKKGLLGSPKAKTSKEGYRYIRVPINGNVMTISEKNTGSRGYASRWRHPGYTGKLFFKQGIDEVLPNIVKKVQNSIKELFDEE